MDRISFNLDADRLGHRNYDIEGNDLRYTNGIIRRQRMLGEEVKNFYVAKAEMIHFISELEAGKMAKALPSLEEAMPPDLPKEEIQESKENPALDLLQELNKYLRGKENSPSPAVKKGE